MPIQDMIARLDQQQQQQNAAAAESRRQTRIGRYKERFVQAFGSTALDDMGVTVDAPGTAEPAAAHGTLVHNSREYILECKRSNHGGLWWFVNGKPMVKHLGSSSNTGSNIQTLLETIRGDQPQPSGVQPVVAE